MRDTRPLRYRDWVPYWALAWLGGWLWATSGPDLTWRLAAAIVLGGFGPLGARAVRYLLVRGWGFDLRGFRLLYRYDCPAGHFTCRSNRQAVLAQMRAEHQENCEVSRG